MWWNGPLACIITSISLDHTEYLGDTIEKIAGEKAGIIKPKIPVIYDGHCREAAAVIRRRAQGTGQPGLRPDRGHVHNGKKRTAGDFAFSSGMVRSLQKPWRSLLLRSIR